MKRKLKMTDLVVAALKDLRDARGSKATDIRKYILARYSAPDSMVKRQLPTALKRGLEFGILKKTRQGYLLEDANISPTINPGNPEDACKTKKKKKKSMRKKLSRRCGMKKKKKPKKKKAKRAACPKKKTMKKKSPSKKNCNVCLNNDTDHDCVNPDYMPEFLDDSAGEEHDERNNYVEEKPVSQRVAKSRSRSRSRSRPRSRSHSRPRSHYSGHSQEPAERDDDAQEDEPHEDEPQEDEM